jgi:hypothetical protein
MSGKRSTFALAGFVVFYLSLPWILKTAYRVLWLNDQPSTTAKINSEPETPPEKSTETQQEPVQTPPEVLSNKESQSLPGEINFESAPEIAGPSLPRVEADECSACMNSVSHIDRHIIVCDTSQWASKIEKEIGTFPSLLYNAIALAQTEAQSSLEIKVTACDQPNELPDQVEVLVYPERIRFFITPTNEEEVSSFARMIVSPSLPVPGDLCLSFRCSEIPWKQLVLVCTHGSRDKRCGRAGPLVIAELLAELKKRGIAEQDLAVRGSSHIGGHKFAGTLIVYPAGQWYGYVTPKVVPELVSCIERGEVLNRCFRGRSNCRENIDW